MLENNSNGSAEQKDQAACCGETSRLSDQAACCGETSRLSDQATCCEPHSVASAQCCEPTQPFSHACCGTPHLPPAPPCAQASPSQASPSQASPSQASPSQASPSQASPSQACGCGSSALPSPASSSPAWNLRYALSLGGIALLWGLIYAYILPVAQWITFDLFGLVEGSHVGASVEFFLYDTTKILLLLVALIYVIAWVRAALAVELVRDFLAGKKRGFGYVLGSTFGAITPFCTCSSIPLFLGFTSARIPFGISMAFLITSPLINELAIVMLWSLLGWKFTMIYVAVGMLAGILGGWLMDTLKAERWLQPFIHEVMAHAPAVATQADRVAASSDAQLGSSSDAQPAASSDAQLGSSSDAQPAASEENKLKLPKLSIRDRHNFAYAETSMIFKRVWKWVFLGVGLGAMLHGFVPENWFAENLGAGEWWTVPMAVLVGIPLYSNVTGIVPIMQSLLLKGLPLGTTLAFCMSSVAASIPEFLLLRQIMTWKLQALFVGYLWIMFTIVGWLFNMFAPYLR